MNFDIKTFLDRYYKDWEPVILACSAGPDSMFLLYKILETGYSKDLVVCYFNHNLREESKEEEIFLEDLGKQKWFKVEIWDAKIRELRDKFYPSMWLEEVARNKRYEFFNAILHIYNSDKIILGHHLDDRIETFFFNLIRWSKITWLINMKEKSSSILRPLLNIEKEDIKNFLDNNNLKYFIDKSNFERDYTRNKLRLDVLPIFQEINSNYKENIANFMDYLSSIKENIDLEVKQFLNSFSDKNIIDKYWRYFEIEKFNSLSSFLQKEVIRYIFFISNNNSTIGLSEANINEVIKFINWKNNKTIKEIKEMKLKKENKILLY